MKPRWLTVLVLACTLCVCHRAAAQAPANAQATKTRNVILVVSDGLRWQEIFRGAEPALMNKAAGAHDPAALDREFGGSTPQARREKLFPFLWGRVARSGQIFGDADHGAQARVTNGKNFSYPGYNELFTGYPDPRIDSNDKVMNPNVTVFEWLANQPGFEGRVGAYGSWNVFPYILARERAKLRVVAGWEPSPEAEPTPGEAALGAVITSIHRTWSDCGYDALTYQLAREYLARRRPRVLFIGLGETDEDAHEGRYDHYLHAAKRADDALAQLWDWVQATPEYQDRTTLLVTADHGRGDAPVEWKSHGANVKGSERIWLAAIGPDTPALGARAGVEITQSQIAATMAALLGHDYRAFAPRADQPIRDLIAGAQHKSPAKQSPQPAP